MPKQALPRLSDLRSGSGGQTESFEELACQLFRRAPEAPAKGRYRRIRGAGGDGGVEAVWLHPDGGAWGLQAKFFSKLGASEKSQIGESLRQAAANYPDLTRYAICLPFVLTGKKGAAPAKTGINVGRKARKPAQGQHETFAAWVADWRVELAAAGRTVELELWDESELLGRLADADVSGGLVRYWFEGEILGEGWFEDRLRDAIAQAGARYTPELTIETPLDDAVHAFGRSETWAQKMESLAKRYFDKVDWWRRSIQERAEPLNDAGLADGAGKLLGTVSGIEDALDRAVEQPSALVEPGFRVAVEAAMVLAAELEPQIRAALMDLHGENADSPGFRQFQAEYMVAFPMAPLDQLRELRAVLAEIEPLACQSAGQLPASSGMLIRGEAGIGKTHGIVDAAKRRADLGLRSIVIFGEDMVGPEPWNAIIAKLGLAGGSGRDTVLDALDAAGEASGYPLVIFIDALNETHPDRSQWQAWLPPMLEQIGRRPSLKLCLSCRDTYLREVIPSGLDLPTVAHNGFLGREYEAQFAFFRHFGLGSPAEPLFQEEFSNPLFLRLVCSSVSEIGERVVPAGREGFGFVVSRLMRAKNERAAKACDFDPRENRVDKAMRRLAVEMASTRSRYILLDRARELIDEGTMARSKSLTAILEGESLISVVEVPAPSLGAEPGHQVRFTFERIGDHLIAECLLQEVAGTHDVFGSDGPMAFLVESEAAAGSNAGLLEALSILLPETHGLELFDVISDADHKLLWQPFLRGLQWRSPGTILLGTRALMRKALSMEATVAPALQAMLGLASRPGNPLNADFLHEWLAPLPMLERDPFWAYLLETSYAGWKEGIDPASAVHRLIDGARRGNLAEVPDEVCVLWATALSWFCTSPDRRIRDRATMAIASIFRFRPGSIVAVLDRFLGNEDEYISERVLLASYGALLLNPDREPLGLAAGRLEAAYFRSGLPPLNASMRDHARLIVDLAIEHGAFSPAEGPTGHHPPYASPWPLELPTEDEVAGLAEDEERFPFMNLATPTGMAVGSDFARYVVEPRIVDAFDIEGAGLDKLGLFRWFLSSVADLGYPGSRDTCAKFDRALVSQVGPGRGRPGWAERLGKKQYWILLRRLAGILGDHASTKDWSGTYPPSDRLQGLDLRDMDPTDMREFLEKDSADDKWVTPARYEFRGTNEVAGDAAWVQSEDLPEISDSIMPVDPDRIAWHLLEGSTTWRGVRSDRRVSSYRMVNQNVHSASCAEQDVGRVEHAFRNGALELGSTGPHDYRGYLGEYPAGRRYKAPHFPEDAFETTCAGISFRYTQMLQMRGNEWGWDYSHSGSCPGLLVPSPDLVDTGGLAWDGRGGWVDGDGVKQIMDPHWKTDAGHGLLVRVEYLDRYLAARGEVLVLLGYQDKVIAGMLDGAGQQVKRSLLIRSGGSTRKVLELEERH